jgi:hypothetical protein
MSHYGDNVDGCTCQWKVHLYGFAYTQVSLHKSSDTAFADVEANRVQWVRGWSLQLSQFKRYAEQRARVFSRTRRAGFCSIFRHERHLHTRIPLIIVLSPGLPEHSSGRKPL